MKQRHFIIKTRNPSYGFTNSFDVYAFIIDEALIIAKQMTNLYIYSIEEIL